MLNFNKFKMEILTNRKTPIVDNTNLVYIKDETIDELFVKIYYDDIEIGQGVVLDFYKEFINIESEDNHVCTQIKTFPFHGATKEKYTNYGNKIYQIKYLKKPPISTPKRENYINEFTDEINQYISHLLEINENLEFTYIPSSSKLPDDIAKELSATSTLPLANIISKDDTIDSKSITTFQEGIKNSITKYSIDENNVNFGKQYIIIDDVMGTGSSIATILKKLYDKTNKSNYFFIVAKDIKR